MIKCNMINVFKNNYEITIKEGFLFIKNYKRIIDISENSIYLFVNDRGIKINGTNMVVCSLDEYDIVIKGIIKSIEYTNE